ncbi:MAG: GldG family protein [Halothece sp.]
MNPRKYTKFLLLLGLFLLTTGFVAGFVSGIWSSIPIALVIAGGVIILVGIGFLGRSSQGFWSHRSTEASTNAFVAVLAVFILFGLVNYLAVRYPVRVDLTETGIYTLSPQTQQIVASLPKPLKVWVFEPTLNPGDRELLENYRRQGENFQFESIDPNFRPGIAQKFNVQSLGEVYVEYGDKTQLVQTVSPSEPLSEIRLTNAIAQIQSDRRPSVYFLQGHGEPPLEAVEGGLSEAATSLREEGYLVEPLNLATLASVPEDAAAVIISSPTRTVFEGEVKALQTYLDRGGSVLLMINPNTNPGLDPLLEEWGVELDDRLVIDASGMGSSIGLGPATPIVTTYGNHPITQAFQNGISFYPLAQPVDSVEIKGIEAESLLITSPESWAESDVETNEVTFDEESDRSGPLSLGFALTRQETKATETSSSEEETVEETDTSEETEAVEETETSEEISPANETESSEETAEADATQAESRLVVIGNSTFATNGFFNQQLNRDVFLNTVNWLSQADNQPLAIRPREPENRRINLSPQQSRLILWGSLIVVPVLGFIIAIGMWWQRR